MKEFDDKGLDEYLTAAAARLATEVQPARDLWPGIEAAISQPQTNTGWQWNGMLAQAAAIVLLISGSSGLTYLVMHEDRQPAVRATALPFEPVSGSFGSHYTLGPDYQDARDDLWLKLQ
ncbi:MAG: hypothetical protein ACR2P1_07495, partial [Pseudomonadales bacterium]